MENTDGMADDAGAPDGAVQRTGDCLGQDCGGTSGEYYMEYGSNYVAPTKAIYGNNGGSMQGPVEKDEKHAIGGKTVCR